MPALPALLLLPCILAQATLLEDTFRKLRQIEVSPEDYSIPAQLSTKAVQLLPKYKSELKRTVLSALRRNLDIPSVIQKALPSAFDVDQRHPYGRIAGIDVQSSPAHPNLRAVTIHLGLLSEQQSFFTLYRRNNSDWLPIMDWDESPNDSDERSTYHLAPVQLGKPDANGNALVLLAAKSGHGANGSYELNVQVHRIHRSGATQMLSKYSYGAKAHQIQLDTDGFRLETMYFSTPHFGCCEPTPYRYQLQGNQFVRIQPVAFTPGQFVAGLIRSDFAEPRVSPEMQGIRKAYKAATLTYEEFLPDEACDKQEKIWQLTVPLTRSGETTNHYFIVERETLTSFRLNSIRKNPLPGCRVMQGYRWQRTIFDKPLDL